VPELPETETIARDLSRLVSGRTITGAQILRPDVLRGTSPGDFADRVVGLTLITVRRRAKTVHLELGGENHLLVTPRFTGALLFDVPEDQYVAVGLELDARHRLVYRDIRRLGTVALVDGPGLRRFDALLGPEPLDPAFTGEVLSGIVRGSHTPIKKLLMDQRRVAGIGNIYANESLWMAAIDPSRSASALSVVECEALVGALRDVLTASIEARGTTFRDYRDARGGQGTFATSLRAYGRGGLPCHRCEARLTETQAVDGRSTVFCHRCQH
jgi:formamidopyrimidine-DNA glycosylase